MGRKFSKKINKKILLQGFGLFIFFATATTLLFQNCSQVSVSDLTLAGKEEAARILRIGAGEVVVEVGASQYDKAEAQFNVGLDTVPPLRQFWFVDNSATMEKNRLNLSSAFGAMFDQSNSDSLYKFDTTAYLFSTGQTVPSFNHVSEYGVAPAIAVLQKNYFDLLQSGTITQSDYDTKFRNATKNSGALPGDNVGISIKKYSSQNDYAIEAAPVLSKKLMENGNLEMTAGIYKPANTVTTNFENEFKSKLSVLQSSRVPEVISGGISYQQSYQVIDRESGLCGVARVLSNPNGMFTSSDMLAFTIVTDENDNDVNGTKCFKRTGKLNGSEDVINGDCWEYETAFKYIVTKTTIPATTCNISGKSGYVAKFNYVNYNADVKYRVLDKASATTYAIPQTKISWEYPRTKTQGRRTKMVFYTETFNAETFRYNRLLTKLNYYTKSCINKTSDGITTLVCTPVAGVKSAYYYGDIRSTCLAEVKKIANSIFELDPNSPDITSAHLYSCDTPAWSGYLDSPTCDVNDGATKCLRQTKAAAFYSLDSGTKTEYSVDGDYTERSACNSQSLAKNSKAVVTDRHGADKIPVCTIDWYDKSCTIGTNCRSIPDSNGTDSKIVKGTFTTGTNSCTNHAEVGINAIKAPTNSVKCVKDADATGSGLCPTDSKTLYGCTDSTSVDTFKMSSAVNKPGFKTVKECVDWAKLQTDNKIVNEATDVVCDLKSPTEYVKTGNLTFADINDNSTSVLNEGNSCGSLSSAFQAKLSSADQLKLQALSTCVIDSVLTGSKNGILMSQSSCEAQKVSDCSSNQLRSCLTSQIAGTPKDTSDPAVAYSPKLMMKADCSTKCNQVTSGFCESYSSQDITISEFFNKKFGDTPTLKRASCDVTSVVQTKKTKVGDAITAQPVANQANFCPTPEGQNKRYFVATSSSYRTTTVVDQFIAGDAVSGGQPVPASDLIDYIKKKITADQLNVNFTVFIRRTGDDPGQAGSGQPIDYIGTHYERLVSETNGQKYPVAATSYADALKNLSAVLKAKLIRGFTVHAMLPHQVVTSVTIVRQSGSQKLAYNDFTQTGKVVTIANNIAFDEGDKVIVEFQNDDGYIRDQLKKIFTIDEMRPDQIVLSVEHIKASGEIVLLNTSQWLKDGNKISIDPSVIINGGDQFRIKFKNNTSEE